MDAEIAVIGPGAIGTWLAWRLSAAAPVLLIGRRAGWLAAARRGLRVKAPRPRGKRPDLRRVTPATKPSGSPAAVFVCVKSEDTASTLGVARALCGPDTPVVFLQNGLTHAAKARRALGARRAVFGACYAAVLREGPAAVAHQAGDMIQLGTTRENAAAAAGARRWLLEAGLACPAPSREDRVLWTKAVFNAATNPVGALTARTNGALAGVPALWDIVRTAFREGAAIASADGHPLSLPGLEERLRRACLAAPGQENSMLQDLRRGRRTEVEPILGPLLAAARRRRVNAPVLAALRRFVARLEKELS